MSTQDEAERLAREFCKEWPTEVYHPNDLAMFFEKGFRSGEKSEKVLQMIAALREENEQLKGELGLLEGSNKDLLAHYESVFNKLTNFREENERLKADLGNTSNDFSDMRDAVDRKDKEIAAIKAEIELHKQTIRMMGDVDKELTSTKSAVQKLVDALKGSYTMLNTMGFIYAGTKKTKLAEELFKQVDDIEEAIAAFNASETRGVK